MQQYREIPYNYTSFSDKEIVHRFLGESSWDLLNQLRENRNTGRSAKMLFEVLGDMWVVNRNPYLQEDLIKNKRRWKSLTEALYSRLNQIRIRSDGNEKVLELLRSADQAVDDFKSCLSEFQSNQNRIKKALLKVTHNNNIRFDALSRASHATDATDWRVEYPAVIITPDTEFEIAAIIKTCIKLGLTIIPRGGGTGYTGGAIPLNTQTAVINTEKLSFIDSVQCNNNMHSVNVGAGVITKRVSEMATANNLVFAVDPTSQDACTIGGNVAMNAGGKKALRWGTTIDNLLSWKMVMPDGKWLQVVRIDHNQDKIQLLDEVSFNIHTLKADAQTVINTKRLDIKSTNLRKNGLGKDVTNKFLDGLPGIQKEGCDGFITSAEFILHQPLKCINTLCLEFFGHDLKLAVSSIVEIKDSIDANAQVDLVGMEHLDARYIKAVNYTTKANRSELPRMVLLIDISAENEALLHTQTDKIITLTQARRGECFVAKSLEKRQIFWQDRANTAAIAAHTNAFKINEDVVIPLDKLSDYSHGIEHINIRLSIENKLATLSEIKTYFQNIHPESTLVKDKITLALSLLNEVNLKWQDALTSLAQDSGFEALQTGKHVISYVNDFAQPLNDLLMGDIFINVRKEVKAIHTKYREIRLFVATHMHAGDGNVHTNIPVHSYHTAMLQQAEAVVDEIMILAEQLGGVISGEHGIGLTKYQYLSDEFKQAFVRYKKEIDPNGHFNKGKLMPNSGLENAFTPSLQLVKQEALILESSEIGEINDMVKSCLRCGKCKSVCTTHVPEANLLYSPRDKIIGTNLISEAFLYEEQTRRGVSIDHFDELNDVADHCTICHRCEKPCPVNIDFGDVSIKMKNILVKQKQRHTNIASKASIAYLNMSQPWKINFTKKLLIDFSYKAQNITSKLCQSFFKKQPDKTVGRPSPFTELVTILDKPLPTDASTAPLRKLLNINEAGSIPILAHPEKSTADSPSVFYFPGCGSERLYSNIGLATIALLYHQGVKVVLPPSYLCCGYPQKSNGYEQKANAMVTDNRVLFHRMANTLNYLDIKHILTSCGTCIDQLITYELGDIFKNSSLTDIHEYLLENKVTLNKTGEQYLYHAPCHDPIKSKNSNTVISEIMNSDVVSSDRCCGEAGTFAVARPDIAKQVKFRKETEIKKDLATLQPTDKPIKMLTTCPACRQGLSRYSDSTGIEPIYPIELIAEQQLGKNWQKDFIKSVHIEKILL
ncbi:FAD/FMN-containing dehydrogenases [uncultured Gammaproteobacteria bacterium]|nr:FAD/FMN-containing dehydrogenases [uncultured Gammaproteobacteria bacterium]